MSHQKPIGSQKPGIMFFDIGANLADPTYYGYYHGKPKHEADLHHVLSRAECAGVRRILLTVGCIEEVPRAVEVAELHGTPSCSSVYRSRMRTHIHNDGLPPDSHRGHGPTRGRLLH